jgi:hypothetical protein
MKKIISLICFAMLFQQSYAQYTRYIIKFKDKQNNPYSISNPSQFLSQRAIDRRTRYNISIDSTDLPVTPRYIDSLRLAGTVTILNVSKWLNQVAIKTSDAAALTKINSFPFVVSTAPVGSVVGKTPVNKILAPEPNNIPVIPTANQLTNTLGSYAYGQSNGQVKVHQGDFLHNHGFRGEGMQLAMLDAGFYHYLSLPTFDSVRNNNQILGTWNFVTNNASVNEANAHGMECLSTIAANIPGTFVGTSPKTSFYLFVTEDIASEYPIEEQNWAAGAEKADSLGVDICSSSLGYSKFDNPALNYTYTDMNGHTTISAKAANFASQKGMLVVIAVGNEGTNPWHYLISPGDADSVLAVGAVDTVGNIASFSSYGPSSDGDIKPAVASVGLNSIVANPANGLPAYNSGTSFACPNMAGLASCLWQAFPEINYSGIINAIESSGTKANNPDDRVGYGIPDMKKAFVILFKKLYTQQIQISDCKATITVSAKTDNTFSIILERKTAAENNYSAIQTLSSNNNFAKHNFSFTDDLSSENFGTVYYRTKIVIGSDTTFYADSSTVNFTQQCAAVENKIAIAPNPVTTYLNVKIDRITTAKAAILIQNVMGQKVYSSETSLTQGVNNNKIQMQQFSKGAYFISVFIDGEKMITQKIIKQ